MNKSITESVKGMPNLDISDLQIKISNIDAHFKVLMQLFSFLYHKCSFNKLKKKNLIILQGFDLFVKSSILTCITVNKKNVNKSYNIL